MSLGLVHEARAGRSDPVGAALARLGRRRRLVLASGLGLVGLAFLLDLASGPARLAVADVAGALLAFDVPARVRVIVWSLRLPSAVMGLLVGAALGTAGAVMQTVLANPLASPYTLGVAAAAGFGAAVAIVLAPNLPVLGLLGAPLAALLCATLATLLLLGLARWRGATRELLVLAGVAVLFLFQALLSLVQLVATPEALAQIVFWLFGSLERASFEKALQLSGALVIALGFLLRDAWRLTALGLGDEQARGLGVAVERLRLRALLLASALAAIAVAHVGTIGFVGLVAPHLARALLGEDQRWLLVGSGLAGALLVALASVASKSLVPGGIVPIGIVTALVGVPFLLWLVLRRPRGGA